jgi:hypothetical protein
MPSFFDNKQCCPKHSCLENPLYKKDNVLRVRLPWIRGVNIFENSTAYAMQLKVVVNKVVVINISVVIFFQK